MLLKEWFEHSSHPPIKVGYKRCHGGGPCHIETSPLICFANHWTGFYMIGTSVMKELNADSRMYLLFASIGVLKLYSRLSLSRTFKGPGDFSRKRKFEIKKILQNEQFSEDLTQYSIFQHLESI